MTNSNAFSQFSSRVRVASNDLQRMAEGMEIDAILTSIRKVFLDNVVVFEFRESGRHREVICAVSNDGIELAANYGSLELLGKIIEKLECIYFHKCIKLDTKKALKDSLTLSFVWDSHFLELDTEKPV